MANRFSQFAAQPAAGQASNRFSQFAPLVQPRTFERDEDETLYRERLAAERLRRAGPRVPMPEVEAATAEQETIQSVQRQRGEEAEQKAFDESRTTLRRASDAATFLASAVPRTITRGEYGIGDVAKGLGLRSLGDALAEGEASFARANEGLLEGAKILGDVTAGVPMLSTMGAPLKGVSATAAAVGNKPSAAAIAKGAVRNERLADIEAFERSGVKPFGPALTEAGTAGVVKQLSDAPIVGAPVRRALGEAIEGTRDAGERIAGQYGDARTYRDVGNVVDQGLSRFKDARAVDLGENAARRLTDDQIAQAARTPARETSIKTKQDALYERAWRGIPEDMQGGRSKKDADRFLGGMNNTRALLQELTDRNQRMFAKTRAGEEVDPTLAYPLRGGVAGRIVQDIIEGRWRGNLQTMRDVRSSFRRLASGMADTEKNTLQLSDMRRLQSSMTEDMIGLLQRNAEHYVQAGKPEIAQKIQRAMHDFRRADQFTRASAGRLDTIEKLYGAQSAEQLALNVAKDAMGGRKGGNYARLLALKRSLQDDEWGDVASGVLRELGKPVASARGAAEEAGFSVQSFVTRWREMSEEGKGALFDRSVDGKALRPALDQFVRVADRMANFEAMANTSRSATNAIGMAGLASVSSAATSGVLTGNWMPMLGLVGTAGGTYAFGKFMTSPAYVRWLTRAVALSGDPGKLRDLRSHVRALARLAAKEPDLPVQELMTGLAHAVDRAASAQIQGQGSGM